MMRPTSQPQSALNHWLIIVLLWLLLIPIIILASPLIAFSVVRFHCRKCRFFKRYHGAVFVVASPHHGWRDFIANNVLPVLPSPEFLICRLHRKSVAQSQLVKDILSRQWPLPAKPFAVRVHANRLELIPLNESLLPLKRQSRAKSDLAQQRVRELLEPTSN
jgi:hypothetical protein